MGKFIDLKGKRFNSWVVISYAGNGKWLCKCDCGNTNYVNSYDLKNNKSKQCNKCRDTNIIDLKNKIFGEWTVLNYIGSGYWKCKCSCGAIRAIEGRKLRDSHSKSCGHTKPNFINMLNKVVGDWNVLNYAGNQYWVCKCSCGKLRYIKGTDLRSNKTLSCGHKKFIDLTGKKINNWQVKEYQDGLWKCECSCGNIRYLPSVNLRTGRSKSCGCKAKESRIKTLFDKYGDFSARKYNPREKWQIDILGSKDNLFNFISNYGYKPRIHELEDSLDTSKSVILRAIHKYDLEDYVIIKPLQSRYEDEIFEFIEQHYKGVIDRHNRSILGMKELDIYIPELKLAIEFNGTYWHSSILKDKEYHQQKTIACAKKGIQLIHIFEYEWNNKSTRQKIEKHIESIINIESAKKIYARNTMVKQIDEQEAKNFNTLYHMQGHSNGCFSAGCIYNNELIGVMTFGKPRFNDTFQYELIRFCWKPNIRVIGGAEKLFKYFIDKNNPDSILTYTDISKFTGNVYTRLGFKPIQPNPITEPNYVWVSDIQEDILTRYQTMKYKLVEQGLGTEDQTEDEIMYSARFFKLYDSGNLRLAWYKDI